METELQVSSQRIDGDDLRLSGLEKLILLVGALFLGLTFDYLFFSKNLGVSYPIFCIFLVGYFLYTARERINFRRKLGWFLLVALLLLSLTFALHANSYLLTLNFLGLPLLLVAYTIISTTKALEWDKPVFIIRLLERVFLATPVTAKPLIFLKKTFSSKKDGRASSTRKQILIGLLISLPILLLVIPLLASADMVFGHYLKNLTDYISFPERALLRLFLIALVTLYVFGYAWNFKFAGPERNSPVSGNKRIVEPVISITLLTMVNLVYLLFTSIQFSYLYIGVDKVLPAGFTYAEYARRGFFELIAVTVVNFLILLITMKMTDKTRRAAKAVNLLLSMMVAFTCNMLFAAHYKLSLYEQSYGYTELRIYVHIFMLFMAVVFVIALLKIWWEKVPLSKAAFVSALVFYLAINYMNVHGMCARYNIDRYYRTGEIDVIYLTQLSNDAVPELVKLIDAPDAAVASKITRHLLDEKKSLQQDRGWMEYNHSDARAKKQLEGLP